MEEDNNTVYVEYMADGQDTQYFSEEGFTKKQAKEKIEAMHLKLEDKSADFVRIEINGEIELLQRESILRIGTTEI